MGNPLVGGRAKSRILIIDDDRDDQRICRAVLEHHGFEVSQAYDGADGIAAVHRERPDLVLMDIRMPGMDGWDATVALRTDPATADIPIVAFTAETMQARPQRASAATFDLLLTKPVGPTQILDAVEVFLNLPSPQGSGTARGAPS